MARVARLAAALALVVLTGALCEALLRLALFSDLLPARLTTALRQPHLYAEPDGDDYWKLHARWIAAPTFGVSHDPLLGVTPPRSARNPLGTADRPRLLPDPDATEPALLFYGDSYLTTPFRNAARRIPRLLEARLAGTAVWNFGMWGYGLDQIVLRLEATLDHFRRPAVLIGLLTDDIDRCVLSVREGPKPRFVLDERGGLQLTNVPIEPDRATYLARHPPQIRSYLGRALRVGACRGPLAGTRACGQRDDRDREKRALAVALVARAVRLCRARGIPLGFVVFHPPWDLEHPTWRPAFLRETLERAGVPYLDTAFPLRRALETGEVSLDDLYDPTTKHHTPRANELIVDAILAVWPRGTPAEQPPAGH